MREPGGERRDQVPDRDGGIVGLRGRPDEAAADDDAVGARVGRLRACSGVAMPKPRATGTSVAALARAMIASNRSASAARSPVVPVTDTV